MNLPRRHPRRAFTLIEIMLALMIFSMVIAAIYSTWMMVMRATKTGQDAAARAQRQRVALRTIEDGLMGIQSFQASQQYYSFIVAGGSSSLLSFAARVPDIFPRNGKFFDPLTGRDFSLRRLTYLLEPGTGEQKNLVLRQNPVLMDLDQDEQQYPLVLAKNVRKFIVECWDTNQLDWTKDWVDTNAIPKLLRVQLVLGGNTSADAPDVSVSRLLSLPSEMMPAMIQNGTVGGLLPPPPVPPLPIKK